MRWMPRCVSYDRLFTAEQPDAGDERFPGAHEPWIAWRSSPGKLEASLKDAKPGTHYQFERVGYFFTDPVDSQPGKPVFDAHGAA